MRGQSLKLADGPDGLTRRQREVLVLHLLEGLSFTETGRSLRIGRTAAMRAFRRGLQKMLAATTFERSDSVARDFDALMKKQR